MPLRTFKAYCATSWRRLFHDERTRRKGLTFFAALVLHFAVVIVSLRDPRFQLPAAEKSRHLVMIDLTKLGDMTMRSTEQKQSGDARDKPVKTPKPEKPVPSTPAKDKPRSAPISVNDIALLLAKAEAVHEPLPAVPNTVPRSGPTWAETGAAGLERTQGQQGMEGLKDFLRAQIERRWEFDVQNMGELDIVVSIHVVLGFDGTVKSAEIVPDPRHTDEPGYRALARSARNAVLISSPLRLPPGMPDAFRDITLNFRPKDVTR